MQRANFGGVFDYGDGNCNNQATFTFNNGKVVDITLNGVPNYKKKVSQLAHFFVLYPQRLIGNQVDILIDFILQILTLRNKIQEAVFQ